MRKSQYIAISLMEDFISIEPKGWEYLETLTEKKRSNDLAFVAMWFDPEVDIVYDTQFKIALEEYGYKGKFRIDHVEHTNKIDDAIIA